MYLCQLWTECAARYLPAILAFTSLFYIDLSNSQNLLLSDAHIASLLLTTRPDHLYTTQL